MTKKTSTMGKVFNAIILLTVIAAIGSFFFSPSKTEGKAAQTLAENATPESPKNDDASMEAARKAIEAWQQTDEIATTLDPGKPANPEKDAKEHTKTMENPQAGWLACILSWFPGASITEQAQVASALGALSALLLTAGTLIWTIIANRDIAKLNAKNLRAQFLIYWIKQKEDLYAIQLAKLAECEFAFIWEGTEGKLISLDEKNKSPGKYEDLPIEGKIAYIFCKKYSEAEDELDSITELPFKPDD